MTDEIAQLNEAVLIAKAAAERLDALTKGDVAGHEFHGNQWSGGGGGSDRSAMQVHQSQFAAERAQNQSSHESAITHHGVSASDHVADAQSHAASAQSEMERAKNAANSGRAEEAKQHLDRATAHVEAWTAHNAAAAAHDTARTSHDLAAKFPTDATAALARAGSEIAGQETEAAHQASLATLNS